jgi:hypothetical protein
MVNNLLMIIRGTDTLIGQTSHLDRLPVPVLVSTAILFAADTWQNYKDQGEIQATFGLLISI